MARVVHRYDPPERFVAGTVGEPGARTFFLQARDGRRITSVSLEKEQVAVLAGRVEEILDQAADRPGNTEPGAAGAAPAFDSDPLDAPITEDFRVGTLVLAWQPSTVPGGDRLVIQAYAVPPPGAAPTEDGPSPRLDVEAELDRLAADLGEDLPPELAESLAGRLARATRRAEESTDGDRDADDSDDADDADADGDDPDDPDDDDAAVSADDDDDDAVSDPLAATEEETDALVVRLDAAAARSFARRCASVVAAGRPPCPFCGRPLDPSGHLCARANGYRPARG